MTNPPLKTSPKSLPRQGLVLCILEAMHIYTSKIFKVKSTYYMFTSNKHLQQDDGHGEKNFKLKNFDESFMEILLQKYYFKIKS